MLAITEANVSKLDTGSSRSEHGHVERQCSMKILVVDSHFLIREALRGFFKQLESNATILEAANGHQATQLISEHPDIRLVLLELNLPDRDGFSVLGELRERHPTALVVVLSARRDRDSVARAFDLGAVGFIPKSGLRKVLLSALGLVLAGGVYIPPEILLDEQCPLANPKLTCLASGAGPVRPADLGLTARQADILELVMKGNSNKAISRTLKLALPTVKNHVTAILKAIKVKNRTEAVIAIGSLGLKRPLVQPHPSPNNTGPDKTSKVVM